MEEKIQILMIWLISGKWKMDYNAYMLEAKLYDVTNKLNGIRAMWLYILCIYEYKYEICKIEEEILEEKEKENEIS